MTQSNGSLTASGNRRFRRALVTAAVLAALAATAPLALRTAEVSAAAPAAPSMMVERDGFADLVAAVQPAVVHISGTARDATERTAARGAPAMPPGLPPGLQEFFGRGLPGMPVPPNGRGIPRGETVGSGFIIAEDGYIVTNNHVVDEAAKITVTLHDGRELEARVVGRDPKTDLALVKVQADGPLPFVAFGDSDRARVGDWVVTVGSPFGLGGTVTAGIISARGRDIRSGPYDDYLQIDAPINRGNSGGPLFDRSGRVVGVNTAIFSPTGGNIGIGFAIPARMVEPIVAQLKTAGHVARGWLGLQIQPVTEAIAESLALEQDKGALVAAVMPGSPAEAAGLRAGDVVLAFAGVPVEAPRDLSRRAAETAAGERVDLSVWRDGASRRLTLAVGAMPAEAAVAATGQAPADVEADTPRLGLAVADASQQPGLAHDAGALVTAVAPGSPAAEVGLRPGDRIVMVDRHKVADAGEMVAAVRQSARARRDHVLLLVRRGEDSHFVTVPFAGA